MCLSSDWYVPWLHTKTALRYEFYMAHQNARSFVASMCVYRRNPISITSIYSSNDRHNRVPDVHITFWPRHAFVSEGSLSDFTKGQEMRTNYSQKHDKTVNGLCALRNRSQRDVICLRWLIIRMFAEHSFVVISPQWLVQSIETTF